MNAHTLTAALEARKHAIEAAWLAAKPAPGSPEYLAWARAYGDAAARYYRAFVWLRPASVQQWGSQRVAVLRDEQGFGIVRQLAA